MSDLSQRITTDMKAAMKAGEKHRVGALRMLRAKLQEAEVQRRAKEGREYELTEDEALQVVSSYAKQRRESIASYRGGGRDDLADKEARELELIQTYLPEQLGEAQIRELARAAIEESGASSAKEIGAVMRVLMPKVKGKADGRLVNGIVRELLGS